MDIKKYAKKNKTMLLIIPIILILVLIPVLVFVFTPDIDTDTGIVSELEIEESIDLSYSNWDIGYQYQWTRVYDQGDYIRIVDSNIGMKAEATLNFNNIDIGKIKMDMREPSASQNYFTMEFRSDGSTLFQLERLSDDFTFVILSNAPIFIVDLEEDWQTVEIVFDLSNGDNGEVSVFIDGVKVIDAFSFDPNNKKINNIWMHTSTQFHASKTDVKFDYLNNYLAT